MAKDEVLNFVGGTVGDKACSWLCKPVGALIIGVIAGVVYYFMVASVKQKIGYNDTFDVYDIQGVAQHFC